MRALRLAISFAAASLTLISVPALAQRASDAYPAKPVALIVAIAIGGPIDTETRLYAKKLTELTGQPFVVDSKPGAGGLVGAGHVVKAAPDGYTLLVVSTTFTVFPAFYKDLPFDTLKDFAPITQMSDKVSVFIAHPSFPAKTFEDYIAYARANPEKINFGTTGAGSIAHLAGGWIHSATNTKVTFIAYKGGGPMLQDLMTGRVSVGSTTLLAGLPLIKSAKVRALALMGAKRSDLLPGIPTIAEQGIPGYNYSTWLGLAAPAATPAATINRIYETMAKVLNSPDIVGALTAQGSLVVGSTPAQFRQVIVTETARWGKVAQDAGITELE